jgi:hypothetical protein
LLVEVGSEANLCVTTGRISARVVFRKSSMAALAVVGSGAETEPWYHKGAW